VPVCTQTSTPPRLMLAQPPAGTTTKTYEPFGSSSRLPRSVLGYRLLSVLLDEPTAIVHDWFQGMHGSERVVETMRSGLFGRDREPDILTFTAARDVLPAELEHRIIRESRLGSLPGFQQVGHQTGRWRYLLPYMPHYFASLDLSAYDIVIASSHACAINVSPRPEALFVCYSHTPMRYAWLPETDTGPVNALTGLGLRLFRGYLRRRDLAASRRPDAFAANSTAVRDRIHRFYGRDAEVIHPPVDVTELDATLEKEPGHFLWVHRLVPYKQPELVLEAFRNLPYRLTMVGVGPLEAQLRKRLPPNVELLPWVSRGELAELFGRASGFVHVAEEDFGISTVEALAAGTPVVALDAGGARDIVRPNIDGVLIERADIESLQTGIRVVAERSWDRAALRGRSLEFSAERFLERMRSWLDEASTQKRGRPASWAR
jgi:glycosyltransferase involved in cell wall biosynthesis